MTAHNLPATTERPQLRTLNFTGFLNGSVIKRAAVIALTLGSILALINQADAVFGNASVNIPRLLLVFLTPFIVVTASQVFAMRQVMIDAIEGISISYESAFETSFSHNIPQRALLMGLVAGSVNSAIVTSVTFATGAALPLAIIAQAYVLPVVFSLLSQTLTYRRAALAHAQ